ncbi:hypothetical protein BH23ACT12_BH23ACT12_00660 [soil metagenome]
MDQRDELGTNETEAEALKDADARSPIDRYFGITAAGSSIKTEVIAGFTTWMTMAYILFVNPSILGAVADRVPGGGDERIPLTLKQAIGVGIGLFIAFIGFINAGFVGKPETPTLLVELGRGGELRGLPVAVFVIGLLLTAYLVARKVRGALLIGILGTTVIAILLNELAAGGNGWPESHRRHPGGLHHHALRLLRHHGHRRRPGGEGGLPGPRWPAALIPAGIAGRLGRRGGRRRLQRLVEHHLHRECRRHLRGGGPA